MKGLPLQKRSSWGCLGSIVAWFPSNAKEAPREAGSPQSSQLAGPHPHSAQQACPSPGTWAHGHMSILSGPTFFTFVCHHVLKYYSSVRNTKKTLTGQINTSEFQLYTLHKKLMIVICKHEIIPCLLELIFLPKIRLYIWL